jgi:predicted Zn-dependent protease
MSQLRLGQYKAAHASLQDLLGANQAIIHFHTGYAMSQMAIGDREGAFSTYREAMKLFPRNVPLTIRYAEALMQDDQPDVAHEVLLDLYNKIPPTPEGVRLIALAASAAGDVADAYYYMAEYHLLRGDLMMAMDQLYLALGIPDLDSIQRARFLSRLEQIQQFAPKNTGQRK